MRAEDRLKRRTKGNPPILAQKQSRPTRETKRPDGLQDLNLRPLRPPVSGTPDCVAPNMETSTRTPAHYSTVSLGQCAPHRARHAQTCATPCTEIYQKHQFGFTGSSGSQLTCAHCVGEARSSIVMTRPTGGNLPEQFALWFYRIGFQFVVRQHDFSRSTCPAGATPRIVEHFTRTPSLGLLLTGFPVNVRSHTAAARSMPQTCATPRAARAP